MIESADAAGTTSRVPSVPAPHGAGPVPAPSDDALLVPGETCWRIERADRHAVFVDAADYFATLKRAVLRAERRVLFIGWDFDPRIRLDPRAPGPAREDRLGRVLEHAVAANPRLEIGSGALRRTPVHEPDDDGEPVRPRETTGQPPAVFSRRPGSRLPAARSPSSGRLVGVAGSVVPRWPRSGRGRRRGRWTTISLGSELS